MTRVSYPFLPEAYLDTLGQERDEDIDLGHAALALAAVDHPGVSLDRYIHHLKKLETDVGERYQSLLSSGAQDDAATRLAALKHILADQEGYAGDEEDYDNLDNADLIRVIDRRRGMPITLSILYIHAGRAQGWDVRGLNMPGHFVCRIEQDGKRLIFDPFHRAALLQAPDLRALLKKTHGEKAELSAAFYEPASPRDILIRLNNNLKLRLIEGEDYQAALKIVERMRRIAPQEYRLLLDAGVLYARVGQNLAAARALEGYIDRAPNSRDRQEAALLLNQIRELLK